MINQLLGFLFGVLRPIEILIGTALVVAFFPVAVRKPFSQNDYRQSAGFIWTLIGFVIIGCFFFTPGVKNIAGAVGLAIGIATSITAVWKLKMWYLLADWPHLFRRTRYHRIKP